MINQWIKQKLCKHCYKLDRVDVNIHNNIFTVYSRCIKCNHFVIKDYTKNQFINRFGSDVLNKVLENHSDFEVNIRNGE